MQSKFFPPYVRQAAKIYVATSYSVVRQETIEISEQRTAFVWFFAQEVDWCMKDCDTQRLQTTVSINLWKILAGHTGDWFDVKTASICTTEHWDVLKSFILSRLKFKRVYRCGSAARWTAVSTQELIGAKPKSIYRAFPLFFLHENSQRECIRVRKLGYLKKDTHSQQWERRLQENERTPSSWAVESLLTSPAGASLRFFLRIMRF